jgi:hypothetical protein
MKKTIRKKIMRDLQQAFVDDPSKFQNDPKDHPINLNSLNFDPKTHNPSDQNFLDLLRDSEDSGLGSQPSANEDGGTPVLVKSGSGSGKNYLLQSLSLSLALLKYIRQVKYEGKVKYERHVTYVRQVTYVIQVREARQIR